MPVPVPLRARFHPLVSFTSSTECCCIRLPDTREYRTPPSGFCAPFATVTKEVHSTTSSHARLRSARSVSHTLDGLLLLRPCRLVSSCSHVRDSTFRGFPRCQAEPPHRRSVPSCRCRDSPTGELPLRHQILPPRRQGVDPSSDPLQQAGGLDLPTTRSPLGFQLLRALLRTPWRRLHAASTHDLCCLALTVHATFGLQRINRCPTRLSVPRLPSRSSFATCPFTPPR
jgi:hypothetical protein